MKQTINKLFNLIQNNNYQYKKLESKNYLKQKRYSKSPQTPIGFKSRSTGSYYLTIVK